MIRIEVNKYLGKLKAYWNPQMQTIAIPSHAHPATLAHELAHAKRKDGGRLSPEDTLDREIATWRLAMITWQGRKPLTIIRRSLYTYAWNCIDRRKARINVESFLAELDKTKICVKLELP